MSPDGSEHVTKGGGVLAIPGRLSNRKLPIRVQHLPKESHQTVEAKEHRSRALDGWIRPLALRLDAQMSATLLKRHFQTPTLHEVTDDLFCHLGGVGGKDGFGRTLARGITSQDPPDRQRIASIAVPQRCAGTDLQGSLPWPIPVQSELLPEGLRIL